MPPIRRKNFYSIKKFRDERTSWCGPFWSDNQWTPNRCGYSTARSRSDQTCKEHDCDLAHGVSTSTADLRFLRNHPNPIIGIAPYLYHFGKNINSKMSNLRPRYYHSNTSGPSGTITRTLRARKLRKHSNKVLHFHSEGGDKVEEDRETGDIISHVLYGGHTTRNRAGSLIMVWCCILKKLIEKHGCHVPNLRENVLEAGTQPGGYKFIVRYSDNNLTVQSPITAFFVNVITTAQELFNQFEGSAFGATENLYFKSIDLIYVPVVGEPNSNFEVMATLNMEHMISRVYNKSLLTIQNVTLNSDLNTSLDIVGTNPLKVYKYAVGSGEVGILGNDIENDPFLGGADLGRATNSTDQTFWFFNRNAAIPEAQKIQMSKPVKPSLVRMCKGFSREYMQPGAILKDTVFDKFTCYFDSWYARDNIGAGADKNKSGKYGKCHFFAFDKVLDSRSEKVAPAITYDNKFDVHVSIFYKKKPPTQPFVQVEEEVY